MPREVRELQDGRDYEAPKLVCIGSVHALTLGCDKTDGGSDGYTYLQNPIHCTSA